MNIEASGSGTGTTYTFSFVVTNPSTAQGARTVNIEASGSGTIASSNMVQDPGDLYGVTNGASDDCLPCQATAL